MGRTVIVALRPKPGREDAPVAFVTEHMPILEREGLVTDRPAIAMRAADATVVEVFEWASKEAIEAAHANDAIQALWRRCAEVCDYVPVAQVPEAAELFPEFTPLFIS